MRLPERRPGWRDNPWLISSVVAMAAFMEVLDISIANVALRHIAGDFSAGVEESAWVLTSYLIANAIILPISGWLSSVIGRKRLLVLSIVGFTFSSLLCGFAPSLGTLVLFRVLQGLTGGGLQPLAQAIISDSTPPHQRGTAFAIYGMSVVLAPAIGPTLGGWITDSFSWRWVFLVNVPVGIVLILLVTAMIHDPAEQIAERIAKLRAGLRIDYFGFSLLALGLGTLQLVLDKGQQYDWFASAFILAGAIASVVLLAVFVVWELGQDDPIVDLNLLRDRNFAMANVLLFMLGFSLFGSTVLLPAMVQQLMGYSATQAGLVLTAGGIAIMLAMPVVGRLIGIVDVRFLLACGLLIGAGALFAMTGFTLQADFAVFAQARVVQALGWSLLFIPMNIAAFATLSRTKSNQASALLNLSRNLGASIGISLVITMLERHTQTHQTVLVAHTTPFDAAYRQTLDQLTDLFQRHGDALGVATQKAQGIVYALVTKQAAMLGYIDNYRMLAVICVLLVPLVLLMRGPSPEGEAPRQSVD
jgi:DHA2 family multidrug resistance protein